MRHSFIDLTHPDLVMLLSYLWLFGFYCNVIYLILQNISLRSFVYHLDLFLFVLLLVCGADGKKKVASRPIILDKLDCNCSSNLIDFSTKGFYLKIFSYTDIQTFYIHQTIYIMIVVWSTILPSLVIWYITKFMRLSSP